MLSEEVQTGESLRSTGITPLHHYYGLLRHPRVFDRFPGVTSYTAYLAPPLSPWDAEGFSSCSACPCPHAVAPTPPEWVSRVSQPTTPHAAFTFTVAGSASGAAHFRGHLCVRLRYGLETRPHPEDEAVERLQKVGFPSPCSPSYRALAFPLVGFPPTEHASLRWTHNRTCDFHRIRLSTFGRSPWHTMKRLFPFRQLHRYVHPWTACAFAGYLCSRLSKG